jgi:5-methylcytosine-specific restriction endonuclease McrA
MMINRLSCLDCQKRREKENNTKKNHSRRAAGELIMTVESLAERDGIKCNICTKPVNMSKSGLDPLGPTIDHLLPVSKGGTNDSFNLALAHRRCNTSRGNRGHAQLLLEITDAWATTKTA